MLRVKGQDGFLPMGPELVPASEFDPTAFTLRTLVNGEVVQESDGGRPALPGRLPAGRPVPAHHTRARRRRAHRDARELAPDGGRRRRRGRDRRASAASPTRSRSGTSTSRAPGDQLAGVAEHAARRPRHPRGRGRAAGGRGEDRMIAIRRIDHVALRVADLDEAARRWAIQFGLTERGARRRPRAAGVRRRAVRARADRGRAARARPHGLRAAPLVLARRRRAPPRRDGRRRTRSATAPLRRATPTATACS